MSEIIHHPEGDEFMGEDKPFVPRAPKVRTAEERLATLNRKMPFADEAEKGVLSGCLHDPAGKLSACRISLPVEAFYHPANRMVYLALIAMLDACAPIDIGSLTHWLRERNELEKVGGPGGLSELYTFLPTSAHFEWYRKIVQRMLKRRQLIGLSAEFIDEAMTHNDEDPDEGVDGLLASAQQRIIALTAGDVQTRFKTWAQICGEVIEDVEDAFNNKGHVPLHRIATGFTSFDRRSGGLEGGCMFVIAARPSMGKTALAMNIVENVAMGRGHYKEYNHPTKPVLVFSLEMAARMLGRRSIVGGANVNLNQVRFGLGSRLDQDNIARRLSDMRPAQIYVVDEPGISIEEQRSIARVMQAQFGIALVMSDYLQLATSESRRAKQNRAMEIGEISHGYKNMAKELNIPVIVLAQLNRKAEDRKGGRPGLADLREGGDIEQDADIVGLLHRESYYSDEAPEDEATLIIAKGRDIGVGEVPLQFHNATTRFLSMTDSLLSNDPEKRDAGSDAQKRAQEKKGGTNYASKDYQGPRGRPRKGDGQPPLDEIFTDD